VCVRLIRVEAACVIRANGSSSERHERQISPLISSSRCTQRQCTLGRLSLLDDGRSMAKATKG
jgi:hypothetical protein